MVEKLGREVAQTAQAAAPMVEKLGREVAQKAQEAAQSLGDATQHASAGPLLQNLHGSMPDGLRQNLQSLPGNLLVQNLQGVAEANAGQLIQQLAPLLTTLLILARTSPGQPLSEAQRAKIAEVFPSMAQEVHQSLTELVPEDPQVTQLRRIADSLAAIEGHLSHAAQLRRIADSLAAIEARLPSASAPAAAAAGSTPEAKSE